MHRVMSALSRNLCIYPCVSGNEFGLFFEYNIYFAQYTANNNIYNKMLNIIAPILKYANIHDKLKAQYMVMIVHSIIAMSVEKAAYERKVHMGRYDDFDLDIQKVKKANGLVKGASDVTSLVCSLVTFEYCTDGTPVCTSQSASGKTQECSASDMTACRGVARC